MSRFVKVGGRWIGPEGVFIAPHASSTPGLWVVVARGKVVDCGNLSEMKRRASRMTHKGE